MFFLIIFSWFLYYGSEFRILAIPTNTSCWKYSQHATWRKNNNAVKTES